MIVSVHYHRNRTDKNLIRFCPKRNIYISFQTKHKGDTNYYAYPYMCPSAGLDTNGPCYYAIIEWYQSKNSNIQMQKFIKPDSFTDRPIGSFTDKPIGCLSFWFSVHLTKKNNIFFLFDFPKAKESFQNRCTIFLWL